MKALVALMMPDGTKYRQATAKAASNAHGGMMTGNALKGAGS